MSETPKEGWDYYGPLTTWEIQQLRQRGRDYREPSTGFGKFAALLTIYAVFTVLFSFDMPSDWSAKDRIRMAGTWPTMFLVVAYDSGKRLERVLNRPRTEP